ncbi:MAG TPA: glycerol-3-phosphate dehydrogenase [Candidatus Methylomirabilis sp.]|nr:glycerol-3-phosphate dehydrogenase [Candidatus Methylomirabilis sp.]
MARITILGAGFMGSALTFPATDNGHQVALWGTWLDDHLVEAVRRGEPHPKLRLPLPPGVRVHPHTQLAEALSGADLVVNAVTSEGTLPVLTRAFPHLAPGTPLMSVSKGLLRRRTGRVDTISAAIVDRLPRSLRRGVPLVVVGGPSKAMELARRVPTAVCYASTDPMTSRRAQGMFQRPYYSIREIADVRGLEVCSAFKNAYAIAIGLCDGLAKAGRWETAHNTKAALFAQAIGEMEILVRSVRGDVATVLGLAAVGDLFVTGVAGRNRAFGEMRGSGMPTHQVVAELSARDELTEGYAAIRMGHTFARQRRLRGLPLLEALYRIVYRGADVERELGRVVHSNRAKRRGS